MSEILYEKKYQRQSLEELEAECAEEKTESHQSDMPFDEFMEKMEKETSYEPISGREKYVDLFVKEAIRLIELHEVDAKITKDHTHIDVQLFLHCGMDLHGFNRLMMMADCFSVFDHVQGYPIVMHIEYYTQSICHKGKKVYPYDWR